MTKLICRLWLLCVHLVVTFWFGMLYSLDSKQRIQRDLVWPGNISAPACTDGAVDSGFTWAPGGKLHLWVKYQGLQLSGAKVLMLILCHQIKTFYPTEETGNVGHFSPSVCCQVVPIYFLHNCNFSVDLLSVILFQAHCCLKWAYFHNFWWQRTRSKDADDEHDCPVYWCNLLYIPSQ